MKERELQNEIVMFALAIITALILATIVSGCIMHTVNGIGKDLQSVSKPYIVDKGD